jgi:hypothetical protein
MITELYNKIYSPHGLSALLDIRCLLWSTKIQYRAHKFAYPILSQMNSLHILMLLSGVA